MADKLPNYPKFPSQIGGSQESSNTVQMRRRNAEQTASAKEVLDDAANSDDDEVTVREITREDSIRELRNFLSRMSVAQCISGHLSQRSESDSDSDVAENVSKVAKNTVPTATPKIPQTQPKRKRKDSVIGDDDPCQDGTESKLDGKPKRSGRES